MWEPIIDKLVDGVHPLVTHLISPLIYIYIYIYIYYIYHIILCFCIFLYSGFDIPLTRRNLKSSSLISKGGAMYIAPIGSPKPAPVGSPRPAPLLPPRFFSHFAFTFLLSNVAVKICFQIWPLPIGSQQESRQKDEMRAPPPKKIKYMGVKLQKHMKE